jgi:hypothetical protein
MMLQILFLLYRTLRVRKGQPQLALNPKMQEFFISSFARQGAFACIRRIALVVALLGP